MLGAIQRKVGLFVPVFPCDFGIRRDHTGTDAERGHLWWPLMHPLQDTRTFDDVTGDELVFVSGVPVYKQSEFVFTKAE